MNKPIYLTISEQIADNIRKSIILGDLKEGMPLREVELAKTYSVSRGPVRDALRTLANEGFLDMIPNVGVKVSKRASDDTLDLVLKLRLDIELFVMSRIYDQFTEDDYLELEKLLALFKTACASNNIHDIIDYDIQFHRFLIDKTDDLHILDLWQSATNRMLFSYNRYENIMESYNEHMLFYKALRAKDKDTLLDILKHHIRL